jgi:hypothetical protein
VEKGEPTLSPGRVQLARGIAMAADLVQIVIFPAFAAGGMAPWDDALDVAVAGLMTWLIGWHWAFLPTFVSELVPFWDLVPTWTAAVFFATRGQGRARGGELAKGAIDAEVVSSVPGPKGPASPI